VATTERDYYELLGVQRGASGAQIKRAFRKLARELHPDVSPDPDSAHRFREVAEAYEVLSDPERRAIYDRLGHAGLRRGGFEPTFAHFGNLSDVFAAFFGDDFLGGTTTRRSPRGPDLQALAEVDLEDAFSGATVSVPLDVALPCGHCGATGAEPGTGARDCSTCGGLGVVRRVSRNVFGQFVQQRSCPECGGAGNVLEAPCRECRGEGRTLVQQSIDVEIPAGIHDGQRIRIAGEGHAGPSGQRGDVFVVVRVRPDPRFVRDGDDLHTAVRLSMTDAALGTRASVVTLDGDAELEVAPGTQPGVVQVLPGRGMPSLHGTRSGDLYVRLDVAVPTQLTDEQRVLLEEFERKTTPENYASGRDDDDGFFQRLKSALR
jgi:molecular chaperone DnaJ